MALEPITRQEKIIAGQDLTPITRMEMFLKQFGGSGCSGGSGGGVTTLHIDVTDVDWGTMTATFTADKTPSEMRQASANGPTWCVISFQAGIMAEDAISIGLPPAWLDGKMTFGGMCASKHEENGNNKNVFAVSPQGLSNTWIVDLTVFGS